MFQSNGPMGLKAAVWMEGRNREKLRNKRTCQLLSDPVARRT